jgi:hypothetical protein
MIQQPPAEYDSALFVNPVSQFECSICHNIQNDPVLCREGHGYCRSCIERWKERSNGCPLCLVALDILVPNRNMRDMIAESLVYCYSRLSGFADASDDESEAGDGVRVDHCTWTGKLQDAAAHFRECDYAGVVCSFQGCGAVVFRKDKARHEATCDHRTIACKWNGCDVKKMRGAELDQHQAECPKRRVVCPIPGCRSLIAFDTVNVHQVRHCEYQVVACPFASVGCTASMLRKDVDSHEDAAIKQHNRLLLRNVNEQRQLIVSLKDQVMPVDERIVLQVKHDELTGKVPFVPRYPTQPNRLYSEKTVVRGLTTSLFMVPKSARPECKDHYGAYIEVHGGPYADKVQHTFELVHHDGNPASAVKSTFEYTYAKAVSVWGFPLFISKARLANPDNNPYVKDGYVTLTCAFKFNYVLHLA